MGWRRYKDKAKRQVKRTGQQASNAWDRYKNTIIPIAAAAGGFLVGGPLGAAAGYSLAQGGVSAYEGHKAEKEAEKQMKVMESGMSQAYSRRRMSRAGGDAVVDFDSNVPTSGAA